MQLPDPDPRIPMLGGLAEAPPPTRREQLAAQGAQAQAQVAQVLAAARRRALRLAILRAGALLGAALLLAVVAGALAAAATAALGGRAVALAVALAGAGGVAFFCLRSPLQRAAALRRPEDLARLLAGNGELLSSVELTQSPPHGASTELLALLHARAAALASRLELRRALPSRALRLPFAALGVSLGVFALCLALAPQRFKVGALRLFKGDAGVPEAELVPIAGDLSITYLYPAYTGLPPRTEEGTAGDLRAPRGTEVRLTARADRDLQEAFAVVNGQPVKLDAQGDGHRKLAGAFSLTKSGTWSLRFTGRRGRVIAQGPSRPVEVLADAAPQVTIEAPTQQTLEVDPQGRVQLNYAATDDYGLTRVELAFQTTGGAEQRVTLQSPAAPAKRLRGTYTWELAPLKLRAGDKVTYHLEARDNDAIDGPQKGVSATQALKVFSAAEHSREALQRAQALWERLLALLGDRLEEKPAPKDAAAGAEWYARTAAQDKGAQKLAQDLAAAGAEIAKDKLGPKPLSRALRYAASSLSPLVTRTGIARAPLSQGTDGREGAVPVFQRALTAEVREEEKDVLYLSDLLDQARVDAMQELGKELAASRRELSRLADKLRSASDEQTKRELLAEVARLRERVEQLMQRMSELAKGINDEHLNDEAVQAAQKEQDLLGQLSDIQKKLQAGKVDEALKELDKLSQELDKVQEGLQKQAGQMQGGKYAKEAQQLQQAAADLKELQQREQDLQKRTAQLRRELHAEAQKRFDAKVGKRLAAQLAEKAAQAKKAVSQIDPKVAEHLGLEDTLDLAQSRTQDLERALKSGDFDEAADLAERASRAVEVLQARLATEDQVAQRYPGFSPDPAGVRKGLSGAQQAAPVLEEISRALQDALPREGQGVSQDQLNRMQQQAREQAELKDKLGKVRNQLGEVGQKVPVFGPQHERMLQQAQDSMGQAEGKLRMGEPRGGEAGEQQALEGLQQFQKAMEQLAKQGGGKGGGEGLPMPWGEPQGEGGDGEGNSAESLDHERVEIPDAEASKGPVEFRKELLDAMKQAPPEKFKERVKQYYEELVK